MIRMSLPTTQLAIGSLAKSVCKWCFIRASNGIQSGFDCQPIIIKYKYIIINHFKCREINKRVGKIIYSNK